jgi:NAD(P)-dependent dehydrogenase (short-subunit alcohol dehydrogenase family)
VAIRDGLRRGDRLCARGGRCRDRLFFHRGSGRRRDPGDLRDAAFCRDLVAKAMAGLGGLDILVNNAGPQKARASILDVANEDSTRP